MCVCVCHCLGSNGLRAVWVMEQHQAHRRWIIRIFYFDLFVFSDFVSFAYFIYLAFPFQSIFLSFNPSLSLCPVVSTLSLPLKGGIVSGFIFWSKSNTQTPIFKMFFHSTWKVLTWKKSMAWKVNHLQESSQLNSSQLKDTSTFECVIALKSAIYNIQQRKREVSNDSSLTPTLPIFLTKCID